MSQHTINYITLQETDSTNNYLSSLCHTQQISELTTVSTSYQTAGKGQRGNSWNSVPGQNLLFSFVTFPAFLHVREQFILSQLISLVIKEVLSRYTNHICIKWPNDIYWKDRKICGILIENELMGSHINQCITGIGLNLNQTEFPSDIPNPVSLKQITGNDYEPQSVLQQIMELFAHYYQQIQQGDSNVWNNIANNYKHSLFRNNGFFPFIDANGLFTARIADVLPNGPLILIDENGERRQYMFKEVQYVL